jgi:hypothetical protein
VLWGRNLIGPKSCEGVCNGQRATMVGRGEAGVSSVGGLSWEGDLVSSVVLMKGGNRSL